MQSCTSPLDSYHLKSSFDQACYFFLQNVTSSFQVLRPRSATSTTWSISMMQRKKFVPFVQSLLGKINTLTIRIPRRTGIQMVKMYVTEGFDFVRGCLEILQYCFTNKTRGERVSTFKSF